MESNLALRACWGLVAVLALAVSPTSAHSQAASGLRIAYLNVREIITQAPDYPKAESTFTKEMAVMQKEMETLQQKFDSAMGEYNRTQPVLSPSARQTKEKALQTQQQTLQQKAGEFQNRVQERERELMRPIEDRVKGIIEGLRAERNISIIFDVGQGGGIVAADRTLDISATVLQRLKAAGQ